MMEAPETPGGKRKRSPNKRFFGDDYVQTPKHSPPDQKRTKKSAGGSPKHNRKKAKTSTGSSSVGGDLMTSEDLKEALKDVVIGRRDPASCMHFNVAKVHAFVATVTAPDPAGAANPLVAQIPAYTATHLTTSTLINGIVNEAVRSTGRVGPAAAAVITGTIVAPNDLTQYQQLCSGYAQMQIEPFYQNVANAAAGGAGAGAAGAVLPLANHYYIATKSYAPIASPIAPITIPGGFHVFD